MLEHTHDPALTSPWQIHGQTGTTTTTTTTTTTILYLNLHYSLCCSLSANTGSVYCRPQRARPSKLTVIGSLCAHECLTSKTFLFNLQSTEGSCPPHHKTPWISSPQYSLTTSSLIDDTITYLTVADFMHMPSFFFIHPSSLPSQYVGNIQKYSLIGIHG